MKYNNIIVILFLFFSIRIFSQDPHFSQFYSNPLYLNPAFAGSITCPRLIMNYRNQWPSIPGNYVTYNASYDQYFSSIHGGLGILANYDQQNKGVYNTGTLNAIYSYHLSVNNSFSIKMGFQASYFYKRLNWTKLTFDDQLDDQYGKIYSSTRETSPDYNTVGSLDFSAGILGYSEKFYFGFATHHLTEPNQAFRGIYPVPRKYTAHIGAIIPIKEGGNGTTRKLDAPVFSPNIIYCKQQDFEQINFGFYFTKASVTGGIWYRQSLGAATNSDALILLAGIKTDSFSFGYSYDLTVSKLSTPSGGAHEVSFSYIFPCPEPRKRARVINCPTF